MRVEVSASTTKPTDPVEVINSSPRIKSAVVPFGPDSEVIVAEGRFGSLVSLDSNTPRTLTTSGTFRQISSSSTRVPKNSPKVSPLSRLVTPAPAPSFLELLMTMEESLNCFSFEEGLDFLRVTSTRA